jgi:hypothetical protein
LRPPLSSVQTITVLGIDDVLSLNNSRFAEYLHHIYPNGLEVEDTIDNQKSASYLDPDLEIIIGGRLKTKL